MVVRRGKAKVGAVGLLGCESEFNIDAVFSDSSTAKNSKNAWSCCVIGPREQTFLQPTCCGLECVGAKNLPVAPVVIFVTGFEAVELLSESFAEKWPERLLCTAIRNPELLVSGDAGIEHAHRVES